MYAIASEGKTPWESPWGRWSRKQTTAATLRVRDMGRLYEKIPHGYSASVKWFRVASDE